MKLVIAAAAALLATVAAAQTPDPMIADPMAGVPAADQTRITRCKTMTHDAMMKNAMCAKMMKLYPAAFAGSASSN